MKVSTDRRLDSFGEDLGSYLDMPDPENVVLARK